MLKEDVSPSSKKERLDVFPRSECCGSQGRACLLLAVGVVSALAGGGGWAWVVFS